MPPEVPLKIRVSCNQKARLPHGTHSLVKTAQVCQHLGQLKALHRDASHLFAIVRGQPS